MSQNQTDRLILNRRQMTDESMDPDVNTPNTHGRGHLSGFRPNCAEFCEMSPVFAANWSAATLVDLLFDYADHELQAAKTELKVIECPKSQLLRKYRDLGEFQFISPCWKAEGRWERRFLIVEPHAKGWETLDQEQQVRYRDRLSYVKAMKDWAASVLWRLSKTAPEVPLAMATDSGHDALQGWFVAYKRTTQQVQKFCRRAEGLGLDAIDLTGEKLARMPNGLTSDNRKQSVIYFDLFALPWANRRLKQARSKDKQIATKLGFAQPEPGTS
jgi:hypothetical protein